MTSSGEQLHCSCCGRPYPRRKLHALGSEPAYICRRCGFWLLTQWRGDHADSE